MFTIYKQESRSIKLLNILQKHSTKTTPYTNRVQPSFIVILDCFGPRSRTTYSIKGHEIVLAVHNPDMFCSVLGDYIFVMKTDTPHYAITYFQLMPYEYGLK